jgi:TolB-like protein/tetratricopeptide (TPR) repeat protein
MGRFFEQLKRRNVLRAAAGYAVLAWLIIQIADTVFPILGVPAWVTTMVVILVIIGFPLTVVVSWIYQWTPAGIMTERAADAAGYTEPIGIGRQIDFVIIVLLIIAVGWLVYDKTIVAPAPENSIAVLPFVNMSDEPGNEYFSDGITEEILNLLARTPDLKVIARTSSFAFKGKNEDLRVIGQTLGVKTVLEGSVRRSGERVRITAQLIDVSDGMHIWSASYDRTMTDIFAVQDDVAAAIIGALQIHIDTNPSRGRPTENTMAYVLFLRAKAALNAYEGEDAEDFLMKAIALDPEFAEAYELLSFCYWYGCSGPSADSEREGLIYEFGAKAFALDPDLVFAEAMYLYGKINDYRYLDRLNTFESAVQKEPTNAVLLDALSWDLSLAGYLREALVVAERYLEIDPLSLPANNTYWRALYAVGRTDDAFAAMEVYDQLGGNNSAWVRGRLDLNEGKDESAIANFEAQLELEGFADTSWVRELVTGARSSANGPAYLDRQIPEIVASMTEEVAIAYRETLSRWYLHLGFLDRFFDLIPDPGTDTVGSVWFDIETPVQEATMIRRSGFTAHPRYLDLAEAFGLIEAWEQRGPPDFCEKVNGKWVCE